MDHLELKARAVESGIISCLFRAHEQPERESYWRKQADMLEKKFITEHGRHYVHFIKREGVKYV